MNKMDITEALETSDEAMEVGYNSCSYRALYSMSDTIRAAFQGLKGVDSLLAEAGFSIDSSARNQLSCIISMLREVKL